MNEIKDVYILVGEYYKSDLFDNETLIIGTFSSLKNALEKLEKWESDKKKYHCWNCDFDIDDCSYEDRKKLTEEYFKNKQCPECKSHLSYSPRYDEFNIEKYIIDGSKGEFEEYMNGYGFSSERVYEAIINDSFTDDTIKERFGYSKEYKLRKPNTKIEIIKEKEK